MQNPPIAKRIPHDVTVHEDRRVDDYYWLRERQNADVVAYLDAENGYADGVLATTEPFQDELYREMVARIKETDSSVPVRRDDFLYYTRTEKDRQYEILCRRRDRVDAPEEILLDENAMAEGHDYFVIGGHAISPNHRLLAYTVDTSGAEVYDLYVLDLVTRTIVDGPISGAAADVEWANDSQTLFYLTLDAQMRPHAALRHEVGAPSADDREMFREPDAAFYVGIEVSRSRDYLFITSESHTSTEVRIVGLVRAARDGGDAVIGEPSLVQPRRPEIEYHLAHTGTSFFILTNDEAVNFRVLEAPIDDLSDRREVIPHRATVKVENVEAFERHLVVVERENGLKRIRVIDLLTRTSRYVAFDDPVYTLWLEHNPEHHSTMLRFSYASLATPRTVFDYDMEAETRVRLKQYEVLEGFDPERYVTERIHAAVNDGTRIPISLVYRKDTRLGPGTPLVLYGYGAYGVSVEPHFVSNRISLLDRGVVFAIAHIRGGGDLGRTWYEYGKRLYKRNTFTDFVACAEHLIAREYTGAGNIVCYGGSAGGLLIGAVLNMRPDLWGAAVAVVPFVDVLSTMLDASLPLTVIEYDEWGNPSERKYYEYIRSYSPYDNIARQRYPSMLVLGGFNDRRVQYWEPAKWVAKLRTHKTDSNPLLLRTRMGEGHKGASGRYDYLRDVALEYAFILSNATLTV
jgi:oligopeptidase B